jgi:hypothetical protein
MEQHLTRTVREGDAIVFTDLQGNAVAEVTIKSGRSGRIMLHAKSMMDGWIEHVPATDWQDQLTGGGRRS